MADLSPYRQSAILQSTMTTQTKRRSTKEEAKGSLTHMNSR